MCGEGLFFLLSGPSGVGKGTIRERLLRVVDGLHFCVSATTRKPRDGEVDGEDYHFLSEREFVRRVQRGDFAEYAQVYGNYYGTPREPMESLLKKGQDVIVEKDVQGALTLREEYPDGVFCFILPPSFEELERRIKARGTEADESRLRRLAKAKREISHLPYYDYFVINDDLAESVRRLRAIMAAEKSRVTRLTCTQLFAGPGGAQRPRRGQSDEEQR